MKRILSAILALALSSSALASQASLSASRQEVLLTTGSGFPNSELPGFPGLEMTLIRGAAVSPNGSHYAAVVSYSGQGISGNAVICDGELVTRSFSINEGYSSTLDLNDAGQLSYVSFVPSFGSFSRLIRWSASTGNEVVSGDNFFVIGPNGVATAVERVKSPCIVADGRVGFLGAIRSGGTVRSVAVFDDNILLIGNGLVPRAGGGPPLQITGLMEEKMDLSNDGSSWTVLAEVNGFRAVVSDGEVVYEIAGQPNSFVATRFSVSDSGSWSVRELNGLGSTLVVDGVVVFVEGDVVAPGAAQQALRFGSQTWAFADTVSSNGSVAINVGLGSSGGSGGVIDGTLVLGEGVDVLASTLIDVDGDLTFSERIEPTLLSPLSILEDGDLVAIALVDAPTTLSGRLLIRYDREETVGIPYCTALRNSTGNRGDLYASGSGVASDNNLTLSVDGLPLSTFGFFVTSLGSLVIPNPGGSSGDLCIANPAIGRYSGSVLNSGAFGSLSMQVDLNAVPTANGSVIVQAGQSRFWQFWYRDTDGAGVATSNFSNAMQVIFE